MEVYFLHPKMKCNDITKSEITPEKIAYSATRVVDRMPPASLGPKQPNIQLAPFNCSRVFNQKA